MFAKSIIIWDEGQQRKGLSLIDLTTTHNNKTEADCLFEPDSLLIDRECLSLDTVMGQMLTAISTTQEFLCDLDRIDTIRARGLLSIFWIFVGL